MSLLKRSLLVSLVLIMAGCASLPAGHSQDARDPWERYNRAVFEFNESLDRAVLKPVAEFYRDSVPEFVQEGLRNFFGNLRDIATAVHQLLQGKPSEAGNATARVAINTTIGLLGLGDPASRMGFGKTSEDFGQTLGVWGVGTGPYFILPLMGPSTVRDTLGFVADTLADPRDLVIQGALEQNIARGLIVIDRRRELLDAETTLEALSFDRYMAIRDAWLARRRSQVYDGEPPLIRYQDE